MWKRFQNRLGSFGDTLGVQAGPFRFPALKSPHTIGVLLKDIGFWDAIRGKRKTFDRRGAKQFVAELERTYQANSPFFDGIAFSVIMPVYDRADTLERAIQSVLDQSHRNFELIIVDDGGNDNSPALAGN